MRSYDFLVVGSGLAGLNFALKAARHGRVALVTKRALEDSNTAWAQGGIAASERRRLRQPRDDTQPPARPATDRGRAVVEDGPSRRRLIGWGALRAEKARRHTTSVWPRPLITAPTQPTIHRDHRRSAQPCGRTPTSTCWKPQRRRSPHRSIRLTEASRSAGAYVLDTGQGD
jgi:glycine/D-amino acid oxidase-like deaminating enzyme